MELENLSLINNDNIAAILYTIISLAFITLPFIIYIVKKRDSSKLIEKYMSVFPNPDDAMDAYYRDKENLSIVEPYRKNALISIIFYFFVMFILSEIITSIAISIYLKVNGFSKEIVDVSSELFNENVYDHMVSILNLVLQILIYTILTIGTVIIMWKPLKKDLSNITGKIFGYGAMGYGLAMAGSLVSTILFAVLGITGYKSSATNQDAIDAMFNTSVLGIILLFISIVIMAPIVEELIFRKSIFKVIKDPKLALIVSTIVFGGLHVVSGTIMEIVLFFDGSGSYLNVILEFVYIIQYSMMGLGFGIAYLKSNKNITSTIFGHMLNNGISFLVMLLAKFFPEILEAFIAFII